MAIQQKMVAGAVKRIQAYKGKRLSVEGVAVVLAIRQWLLSGTPEGGYVVVNVQTIAHNAGVGVRTVSRWVAIFRKYGLIGYKHDRSSHPKERLCLCMTDALLHGDMDALPLQGKPGRPRKRKVGRPKKVSEAKCYKV